MQEQQEILVLEHRTSESEIEEKDRHSRLATKSEWITMMIR